MPSILTSEVERAFGQMRSGKAPGEDRVVAEMMRAGGEMALGEIRELFNAVLRMEAVPREWKNAIIALVLERGDGRVLVG